MSILDRMNKWFRIDTYGEASTEYEILKLMEYSCIDVPKEYLEIIREKTELEVCVNEKSYIRIWGANGCVEMNDAYNIQRYIPDSLAIGDDEGGSAILYANGKNGFGVYKIAFNDLDEDELIYVSESLEKLLVCAEGVEKIS